MKNASRRSGWVSSFGFAIGLASLGLTACSTTTVVTAPASSATKATLSDEDDFSQLVAQLRTDLNRNIKRENERQPKQTAGTRAGRPRDSDFAARAQALFAPLSGATLQMPVVGIRSVDLDDSWGAPRDGGSRPHRGIDIFAARGTPVIAVTEGIISYIGDQPKGGHCLWLTTESGTSFYYAHLERWAPGLYEGMEVRRGDVLGYVGNTGNALTTPPHLHFGVNQNDEMINPYPILSHAMVVKSAQARPPLGAGYGTR
jgi:murein DD-endopeptidase MepM/ murein hydrolase activator NlpD